MLMEITPARAKVKVDHGGGVVTSAGYAENLRLDGNKLRGDITFLKSADDAEILLELAEEMPSELGISATLERNLETIEGKQYIRPKHLRSFDFVDVPAANPTGMYEQKSNPEKIMTEEEYTKLQADMAALSETVTGLQTALKALEDAKPDEEAEMSEDEKAEMEKAEKELEAEKEKELEAKVSAIALSAISGKVVELTEIATAGAAKTLKAVLGKSISLSQPNAGPAPEKNFEDVVARYQKEGKTKAEATALAVKTHTELFAEYRAKQNTTTV
jgi:hypothetical protein